MSDEKCKYIIKSKYSNSYFIKDNIDRRCEHEAKYNGYCQFHRKHDSEVFCDCGNEISEDQLTRVGVCKECQ